MSSSLNIQPQTLPLDLSSYGFTPPFMPFFNPGLLSFLDIHSAKQYELPTQTDINAMVPIVRIEQNNNDSSSIQQQVSSSLSESSQNSPPERENVIVKNESKRKKTSNTSESDNDKEIVKDDLYWERRRKNNDAAKKSRDSRRQKEDEMASRAAVLEHENVRLRIELEQLKAEADQLRNILLAPPPIKAPVAVHGSSLLVPASFAQLPRIPAPSVILQNELFSGQHHPLFPDSTQRNTVLVHNKS